MGQTYSVALFREDTRTSSAVTRYFVLSVAVSAAHTPTVTGMAVSRSATQHSTDMIRFLIVFNLSVKF